MKTRILLLALALCACQDEQPKEPEEDHEHKVTTDGAKKLNRLAKEKSVYLRQHASNPVDWYPWGDEAFEKAKRENKPVFLSIGYSSCHWCHVMEHESFADQEVADLLNKHFVAIKVDREERPDVDAIYMNAAMAIMRGGGGWPLSVWLTPERKPFHAGTYFPKHTNPRFGRIGFVELLTTIAEAWKDEEQRRKILNGANQIAGYVQDMYDQEEPGPLDAEVLKNARDGAALGYDATLGGFGSPQRGYAPKFPSPSTVELVLRAALREEDKQALEIVTNTLDRMAKGGIHDHVGGGFHRYSTTRDWLVPHFEKMLYDNAQLLGLYSWAYLVTKDELYADTARDIALWVQREMTNEQGGFFAAQDADDPGGPEHEGGFYVWDPKEMRDLFGDKDAAILSDWFHISSKGNWFLPNGEQEKPGKSLLQIRRPAADVAKQFDTSAEQLKALVAKAKATMYDVREKRPKPITDPKVLTAWNALMVSGFCKAYQALGDESFLVAARRGAEFLRKNLRRDGRVLRRWAEGEAAFDGVLDDYAYSIAASLDLYETTFETNWLEDALALTETTIRLFHDEKDGGFFFTVSDGETLIARGKSGTDNARPSANGVMAFNLLRISELTGDQKRRAMAVRALEYFGTQASVSMLGYGTILNALDFAQKGTREIFIAGDPTEAATRALIEAAWRDPRPNRVIALVTPAIEKLLPPAAGKVTVDGKPAAYVCRNFTCDAPVTDPEELKK